MTRAPERPLWAELPITGGDVSRFVEYRTPPLDREVDDYHGSLPAVPPARWAVPRAHWPLRRRVATRLFGLYVIAAVVTCYAIEPAPNGPDPDPGAWFDAVDLLALATFVVSAVVLVRAAHGARWAGLAAGWRWSPRP